MAVRKKCKSAVELRAQKQSAQKQNDQAQDRPKANAVKRITMVTAYDATMASIVDKAGVDAILVGDSLGMVIQGHRNTLPVTLDHMIYHTAAVTRVVQSAHVVGDLPFMTYQTSPEQALTSAGRLVQEGGAHSVKLEGGSEMVLHIRRIVRAGIPVMGHIGLTPQAVHAMGGFKVQGKNNEAAHQLIADAQALEQAGCYAIVIEGIPGELATHISQGLTIPTIGIGAGAGCDGQVLVSTDLLGMNPDFKPKFVKTYADTFSLMTDALKEFIDEVQSGAFPQKEHTFSSPGLDMAGIRQIASPRRRASDFLETVNTPFVAAHPDNKISEKQRSIQSTSSASGDDTNDDADDDMGLYGVPV